MLIYPNPLNPKRYVVLNSGFTFREYDYLNNARQTPKLPDWAVIDVTTPPSIALAGQGGGGGVLRRAVAPAEGEMRISSLRTAGGRVLECGEDRRFAIFSSPAVIALKRECKAAILAALQDTSDSLSRTPRSVILSALAPTDARLPPACRPRRSRTLCNASIVPFSPRACAAGRGRGQLAIGAAPPVVAGYERFHADKADARGGALLLTELGCVKCHESTSKDLAAKPGPILDNVASRARVSWLRKYLNDPHAVKPGTTMPHLLADDQQKADKVEALVHLLASTGGLRHERRACPSRSPPARRCTNAPAASPATAREQGHRRGRRPHLHAIPLGDLKAKYSIPSLASFLQDPLHVRPGGRMPRILDAKESKEVANTCCRG